MDSYILLEQMVPRIKISRKAFGKALQNSIFTRLKGVADIFVRVHAIQFCRRKKMDSQV
jgi:hypothetical protein